VTFAPTACCRAHHLRRGGAGQPGPWLTARSGARPARFEVRAGWAIAQVRRQPADTWERATTDEVIDRVDSEGGDARAKLRRTFALVSSSDQLLAIDLAVRDWSRHDQAVAERLRRVDNRRMDGLAADRRLAWWRCRADVGRRLVGKPRLQARAGMPVEVEERRPGWVQSALGGPDAPFTIEESVPALVNVLLAKRERPGLEYLDRFGRTVPW
jgi:hypothetical protein